METSQTFSVADGAKEGNQYEVLLVIPKLNSYLLKKRRILELTQLNTNENKIVLKSNIEGFIRTIHVKPGDVMKLGSKLITVEACSHPTVLGSICCDCGTVLDIDCTDKNTGCHTQANISMLHSIPDLKVSREEAERLGAEDISNLLECKKLVLLVDLDQTLIHTTNDQIPPNIKDVFHFQFISNGPWYHTRLRPYTKKFLQKISELYELHICTFGVREYAHYIAKFLDPQKKLFGHRILSRNECLDPMSKKANLNSLFPCGDNLVCIIDDRSDVWNFAPNVVQVLPYHFFKHTGDINAPPGLQKKEDDEQKGFDFLHMELKVSGKQKTYMKSVSSDSPNESTNEKDKETKEENISKMANASTKRNSSNLEDSDQNEEKASRERSKKIKVDIENEQVYIKYQDDVTNNKVSGEEKDLLIDKLDKEEQIVNTTDKLDTIDKLHTDQMKVDTTCTAEKLDDGTGKIDNDEKKSDSTDKFGNDTKKDGTMDKLDTVAKNDDATKEEKSDIIENEKNDEERNNCKQITNEENVDDREEEFVDVEDNDDYLLYLEDILVKLHSRFYKYYDGTRPKLPDLKQIVPKLREEVLVGVNVVFSSIIPNHMTLANSKAYHVAKSLGANVTEKIRTKKDRFQTTHLIAANLYTEKSKRAKKLGIHIVNPNWLWCCAERWEKVEERLYSVENTNFERNPPLHCLLPRVAESRATTSIKENEDTSLIGNINPLMYFSVTDTKNMKDEVDTCLSDDSDDDDKESFESSESHYDESSDDSQRNCKRKRNEDDTADSEDDQLPSVLFRQGDVPSDLSDDTSENDEDLNAYGDILERELLD